MKEALFFIEGVVGQDCVAVKILCPKVLMFGKDEHRPTV